jgi:hypothetical protein
MMTEDFRFVFAGTRRQIINEVSRLGSVANTLPDEVYPVHVVLNWGGEVNTAYMFHDSIELNYFMRGCFAMLTALKGEPNG